MHQTDKERLADFYDGLLERIAALHAQAHDPAAFAQLRHEILQDYFGTLETDRQEEVRTLQDQIDMEAAMTLNPERMTWKLLGMIDDHIDVMKALAARHAT